MYALDSAHEGVRRLNRCRTFAILFDWSNRIERRVDTNTNLSNLIDSYVESNNYVRHMKSSAFELGLSR